MKMHCVLKFNNKTTSSLLLCHMIKQIGKTNHTIIKSFQHYGFINMQLSYSITTASNISLK